MNKKNESSIQRRDFLRYSAATVGAGAAASAIPCGVQTAIAGDAPGQPAIGAVEHEREHEREHESEYERKYNTEYSGQRLNHVAFPMGGLGAGMICLEGTGALSHFSLRNRPDIFNEPCTFAAISIKGKNNVARVLEGPVPTRKVFGLPGGGGGCSGSTYGLPRFQQATFVARFPFATVKLSDSQVPLEVEVTGWSPFEPNEADDSSLPVAGLEYKFTNRTSATIEAVFSFNAKNFMVNGGNPQAVKAAPGGFVLESFDGKDSPWDNGGFSATTSDANVKVNHAWFRGGWFDSLTMAWKDIADAACFDRPVITEGGASPGGTLFVPLKLEPGESKTVVLQLAWYVGASDLRIGVESQPSAKAVPGAYRPWYAGRFANVQAVAAYWRKNYDGLRKKSERFSACFYDSTLPAEVIEAVAANLTILKSPTVLRQSDGRLWSWEGCGDNCGCCHGSCTHVWNYAQAIPHLFPALERTLRETEFGQSQDDRGHQTFRSALPIQPVDHGFHAASDGQLGGVMKAYREWRICGDTTWLRNLWPKIKASLSYCIKTWDPGHKGLVEEPHHNTYDIEFWGPDPMCTSFYLGALRAAVVMGEAIGEDVSEFAALFEKGSRAVEKELFNDEYYFQKIEWKTLRAKNPIDVKSMAGEYSPEAQALLVKEGPKYQYGKGCLSDGVLGSWLAAVCGVGQILDRPRVASHLNSIHRYNLKKSLADFANPQRPGYACGDEGGVILCTWPKGGELSLPFVYSNEVWTGIEYQVASHLMLMGLVKEGLDIVRTCRDRYDGRVRNPFNEYECGHWYARAMSSYGLLQGMSGARYDAVEKVLYLHPSIGGDFRCFLSTAGGYGTVGVKDGKPFCDVKHGKIDVQQIKYAPVNPAIGESKAT